MYQYGVQWREGLVDWWHDYPGSFANFSDEADAYDYYSSLLGSLRLHARPGTTFRCIQIPLHNVKEMAW